jgi:dipeptide/tripeptide permease
MANYQDVFQMMGLIALSVAVVLLLLSPILKKLMHLDKSIDHDEGASLTTEA